MNYKYRHIILRSIKIGVGTTLAIIIAGFFKLDYPTAAGTITLLTLLTTKKETVKLIINRFITFSILHGKLRVPKDFNWNYIS